MDSAELFPESVPRLANDRVQLRELTESDIPAWYERATDRESAFLAGDSIPGSIDAGSEWLERSRQRFRNQEAIRWAIVPRGMGQSVGSIGIAIISPAERVGELGFVVARAHWGRGIATAAGELVVRYALQALQLAEIRAEVLEAHAASRRVLEKLGFAFQHVIPDFDANESGPLDGCLYALRRPTAGGA